MTLNSKQFRQTRLFNPLSVPRRQPHQMSMLEFAQSPRTWFHGSSGADIKDVRSDALLHTGSGFHVGSLRSAVDRIGQREGGTAHDRVIHPGRIDVPMKNTPATRIHDEGMSWFPDHHRSFYHNEYEDVGSTSAILRSPFDFKTHRDYVEDAVKTGGIPSGHAEHDAQHNHVLKLTDVDVVQTSGVSEHHKRRAPRGNSHSIPETVNYHHALRYVDPRQRISTKMWGPRETFEQLPLGLNPTQFHPTPPD